MQYVNTNDIVTKHRSGRVNLEDYVGVENAIVSDHQSLKSARVRAGVLGQRATKAGVPVAFRAVQLTDGSFKVIANLTV